MRKFFKMIKKKITKFCKRFNRAKRPLTTKKDGIIMDKQRAKKLALALIDEIFGGEGETVNEQPKKEEPKKEQPKKENPAQEETKRDASGEKFFTRNAPPKNKDEIQLYRKHWAELGAQGLQDDYLKGLIDSLGYPIESAPMTVEVKEEPKKEKGKPGRKPKEEKPAGISKENLISEFKKYVETNGRESAMELLASFGAQKFTDIKSSEYPKFAAAMSGENPEIETASDDDLLGV